MFTSILISWSLYEHYYLDGIATKPTHITSSHFEVLSSLPILIAQAKPPSHKGFSFP